MDIFGTLDKVKSSYKFDYKKFNKVMIKRPEMIEYVNFPEYKWPSRDLKSKDIKDLEYYPVMFFDLTSKDIHKKEAYINLGIIGYCSPDFEILKESKIQMRNLKIETTDFKGIPDELELSESILGTLESIHVVLEYGCIIINP